MTCMSNLPPSGCSLAISNPAVRSSLLKLDGGYAVETMPWFVVLGWYHYYPGWIEARKMGQPQLQTILICALAKVTGKSKEMSQRKNKVLRSWQVNWDIWYGMFPTIATSVTPLSLIYHQHLPPEGLRRARYFSNDRLARIATRPRRLNIADWSRYRNR